MRSLMQFAAMCADQWGIGQVVRAYYDRQHDEVLIRTADALTWAVTMLPRPERFERFGLTLILTERERIA